MEKSRIMVVEDEGLVALEIKEGLESMGYSVPHVVSSGEEAIEKVRETAPDLVLMDIRLEGAIDGIEAAKHIRDNFSVPVIFLTAHSDEETLQKAKVTESFGYLLKPFEEKALKAAIEIALYKAASERRLKGSQEWISLVFRSLKEGVIVTDVKGDVRFLNDYAADVLRSTAKDAVGRRITEIFRTEDKASHHPQLLPFASSLMDGKITDKQNTLLVRGDGDKLLIDYTLAPLKNDNEFTIGLILVFRDKSKETVQQDLLRQELEKPVQMQKSLLPAKNSSFMGLHIDWFFAPSSFGSGDLFNVIKLGDSHIGFYLFDVMGHGFSAAIFSMTLHRLLMPDTEHGGILRRAPSEETEHPHRRSIDRMPNINSPARVITELNRRFYFEDNTNPFFTICYGIINTATGAGRIARAGHIPALHARNGVLSPLESQGFAVGIYPEMEVTEREFQLEKGDRLFLYSDGLIEATNRNMNRYSNERLVAFLKNAEGRPLSNLIADLERTLSEWREDKAFDDDAALLVLERD